MSDNFNKHKKFIIYICRTCHWLEYTQFVYWVYGKLRRGNRKIILACIVNEMRKTLPSADGIYTGFKFSTLNTMPESTRQHVHTSTCPYVHMAMSQLFFPLLNFILPLFFGMVIYDNEMKLKEE